MKRFFKWILITIGSLLVISILAVIILPNVYRDAIRIDLEKEIDQQVDADVTFSEVKLNLFRHFPNLTVSLHDLLIVGKNEFKSDTLAWVKKAHLKVNLWSLIAKHEIEIKSVDLFDPEINVYILKDGKANYDIVKKSDSTSQEKHSNVNIAIDKVNIEEGDIFYSDWKQNIFVKAVNIEHEGSGDFLEDVFDYKTKTIVRQFSLNYDNIQYFLKKEIGIEMIMEMNLPESKFTFKENRIQINHFIFSVDGFFQQVVDRYAMNLKFQAEETTFKNILSLVPGLYMKNFDYMETKGDLAFSGFLDGVYSGSTNELPAFHLDINVKDAMVKIDSLPEAFNNIQFELVVDNKEHILDSTVIDLKKFHVDLGKHPVNGRLKLAGLHKPKIDADIFANVEVAALERLYPIKNFTLKGKVNLELKAKGMYDAKNSLFPPFNLNLKLADGYARYDSFPRPISNVQFHLSAENKTGDLDNTVVDFRQIHAEVDDNILHGFVKLKGYPDTEVDADLDADLDLEDIEKIYPVDGYQLKGKFNIDLLAKGLYSKEKKKFPLVDSKMTLADGSVQYKGYPHPIKDIHFFAEAVSKTGDLADAKLTVSKLTYTLEDEPFTISGSLTDLNKYEYSFKIDGKADLSKISQVYPLDGINLSGILDAHIRTKGLLSDLEAGNYTKVTTRGKLKFAGVNISGPKVSNPIRIDSAVFKFNPSKIVLQKLEGKFGKSNLKVTGDITNYMAFMTKGNELIKGDLKLQC
ncbi:MAG TPA: AsmA family protein, partial [Cyclobacteriaceae bacterium]|nr:AsmA family protein [Cyclobacteriaceae bacterium]